MMATPMTLKQEKFQNLLAKYREQADIVPVQCDGLMEFVEHGDLDGQELDDYFAEKLSPVLTDDTESIVLGCTHYPFLLPVFRQVIGERGVAVVDPSPAVGRRVGQLLDQYDLRAEKGAAANYGFLTFADEAYRSRLECKAFG